MCDLECKMFFDRTAFVEFLVFVAFITFERSQLNGLMFATHNHDFDTTNSFLRISTNYC